MMASHDHGRGPDRSDRPGRDCRELFRKSDAVAFQKRGLGAVVGGGRTVLPSVAQKRHSERPSRAHTRSAGFGQPRR